MRRTIVALFLFVASVAWISAQDLYTETFLGKLGLTQAKIEQILEIQNTTRNQIREAALEMNIFKAQLEKMLYDEHPDMKKVKKLLEESLKYRLQSEMAAIEARVKTRGLMGEKAWGKMLQMKKRVNRENRNRTQNQNERAPLQPERRNKETGTPGSSHGR